MNATLSLTTGFTLSLTTAGLDALVDAQSGATDAIKIAEVGFSDQAVTVAPTLTALPGEIKRIASVSGIAISETVIHMTAQDSTDDLYDVRSFALYLDDGTLFGAYSQTDPIVSKAPVLNLQLAFDIAFQDAVAGDIEFGNATFLFPPATEEIKGVAEIATQSEVDTGSDDERFVTPLKLATRLADAFGAIVSATETVEGVAELATQAEANAGTDDARIVTPLKLAGVLAPVIQSVIDEASARALDIAALQSNINAEETARQNADGSLESDINTLENRTVTGSGIATGGGALRNNPVISVVAASAAQLLAGNTNTAAITPGAFGPIVKSLGTTGYIAVSFGDPANALMLAWGRFTATPNSTKSVTFPMAFSQCFSVVTDGTSDTNTNAQDNFPAVRPNSISATGFQVFSANQNSDAMAYIAIGRVNLS